MEGQAIQEDSRGAGMNTRLAHFQTLVLIEQGKALGLKALGDRDVLQRRDVFQDSAAPRMRGSHGVSFALIYSLRTSRAQWPPSDVRPGTCSSSASRCRSGKARSTARTT